MTKLIAYYRVSTKKQGKSGLGLEAQKECVKNYAASKSATVLESYTDVCTGKKNNRPELLKAIDHAKKEGVTLVIAKLDRLSRNASFILKLNDSKLNFICCDMPDLNTLTIGIFASVAQYECELISKRTKAALAEKKRQGFKLGNPQNLTDDARLKGHQASRDKAEQNPNNKKAKGYIISLRNENKTFRQIASILNENSFKTSRGLSFQANTVKRLFDRYNTPKRATA